MESIINKLNKLTENINLNPNKELYRKRAILYNKLEKFDLAMKDYDNIIKLDFKDYDAYYERACEWYNWKIYYLDEMPSAEEIESNTISYLEKSLNIKVTSKCYYRMAEIYFNLLDKNDESLKYCKQALAIEKNPKEKIEILKLLGEIYNELGNYNNAIKIFDSILAQNKDSDTFFFRGLAYCNLAEDENCSDMYKKALDDYKSALKLDSENTFIYIKMARVLKDVFNKTKSASKCYEKILELDQDNEEANEFLANYYYDNCDYENAIKCIDNIGRIESELNYYLESRKAECYYELGDYGEALKIYNELLAIKKDASIYDYRGDVYLKLGQYDKAISDYNKFLKSYPESKGIYYRLGIAYKEKGDKDTALEMLERALKLLPGNKKIIDLINEISNSRV